MPSTIETAIRSAVMAGIRVVAGVNRVFLREPPGGNPFLQGIHAPMTEELTLSGLKFTGEIPKELDGKYVRIGPNPLSGTNAAAHHWFAGDGMVHGIRLHDGKAEWYRNRWIRSMAVSDALGEPHAPGKRGFNDNVNTNVMSHAGRTFALVEAGATPVELNDDLSTDSHNPFDGTLDTSFSAHPHLNPQTGELHAICYHAPDTTRIWHVIVDVHGKVRRCEPIPVAHGPSIHDCTITSRYVIILDLPVTFSMRTLLSGRSFPYRWNESHQARIGLLPLEGTSDDIIWCDVDPCYIFHTAGAWEEKDGKVIMNAAVYDSMFSSPNNGPDTSQNRFERLKIDPATRTVRREVIDDQRQEFPRLDERLLGRSYRFAYCLALLEEDTNDVAGDSKLLKHDLVSGTKEVHDFGSGQVPGEFVFVPSSPDAAEDHGWLMGYVIDSANETTQLSILRADDFTGPPQATITVPHRIPPGFHGNWIPQS